MIIVKKLINMKSHMLSRWIYLENAIFLLALQHEKNCKKGKYYNLKQLSYCWTLSSLFSLLIDNTYPKKAFGWVRLFICVGVCVCVYVCVNALKKFKTGLNICETQVVGEIGWNLKDQVKFYYEYKQERKKKS